ncbi:hypothetical protein IQ06DRAFT_69090 [Phaeosphaeriaceae sp. SRC1lsM3a]|nr:hypothetical protein IQ06DRAFT_69090 [Stagonospora sp. SRC1lsM3a]
MSTLSKITFTSTVLYKRTPDLKFDLDYYLAHHIPLCLRLWKPRGVLDCRVVEAAPDQEYAYICTMMWGDESEFKTAFAQEDEIKEIMGDVGNYTNGKPITVAGRVVTG